MPADVFLDTNLLVYSFDADSPEKQRKAKKLLAGSGWFLSWQVIQEFSSVAVRLVNLWPRATGLTPPAFSCGSPR